MRWPASILSYIRSYDWVLVALSSVLVSIGFAAIYSVDLSRNINPLVFIPTQALACAIGIVALFLFGGVRLSVYEAASRFFYPATLLLLVLVLFFGTTIRGTTGWFRVGQFSFQPAEFAKISVILLLSLVISRIGRRFDRIQFLIITGVALALPVGLIFLQPDFGSAFVLISIWGGLLLLTVRKKRYIFGLAACAIVLSILGWFFFFKPYQRERFLTFIDPYRDPLGAGYNVTQSLVAVGSGKFFGRGLGFGSQSQLRFLPEAQTDFIFSVIAEELGFLGATLLLLFYILLFWRLVYIAKRGRGDFGTYTVLGILWLFFIQMSLNIGATLGLVPITGVTLPLVSYGGSSLVANFILLGIVQSVARESSA